LFDTFFDNQLVLSNKNLVGTLNFKYFEPYIYSDYLLLHWVFLLLVLIAEERYTPEIEPKLVANFRRIIANPSFGI
jgi:hypothetical protein